MTHLAQRIYNELPAPARSLAATLRGFQLRSWRYGPETDQLIAETIAREHWTTDQWAVWKQERLAEVLQQAATKVPYYREQWATRRRGGDRSSWEMLENWPLLDKEEVRKNPKAFVADGRNVSRMFHDHTSGSSGKSLDVWLTKETVRLWYALFEARCRYWYGVSRSSRWGVLGGQLITPVTDREPPFWIRNYALKQLYMSSYHLAPDLLPHYFKAIKQFRVEYLLGYASSLFELAQAALRLQPSLPKLKVVVVNAEPLYDYQRRTIEEAFQCPVRETYGMAETVAAASECEAGRMHLWPEAGIMEVLPDENRVKNGEAGELVCTGLINIDMPLIRYRVGDRGTLEPPSIPCRCGRTLPILSKIEGRIDETLYTRDGRRIGRLDPVFKSQLPIREAQIIQESLEQIRIKYVPADTWTPAANKTLVERLQDRVGNVSVVLEPVDVLPRGSNGKFRAVICELSPEQIEAVRFGNTSVKVPGSPERRKVTTLRIGPDVKVRRVMRKELSQVAAVHMAAFPNSAITLMGQEAVRRYYDWQLVGPHIVLALGAFSSDQCLGFCFGGVFRGATSGFLARNRAYLTWRVLTHPWLITNEIFRGRLKMAARLLRRRPAAKGIYVSNAPRSFEILAIAVDPRSQRTGIGELLMHEAEAIARKHSFHQIHLTVHAKNAQVIRFYQGLGWQKTESGAVWRGEMKKYL